MAKYEGPRCKSCRREGVKLFLKGNKCYSDKCPIERKHYVPGQHVSVSRKLSDYGIQLREKQKARRIYGVLEKQFKKYFEEASRRKGIKGDNLLKILESRLDNVVYRMGFASSRAEARQLVRHRIFLVNRKIVDIPSYQVREGDTIEVCDKSKSVERIKISAEEAKQRETLPWLQVDFDNLKGKILAIPQRDQIDTQIKEQLIVEYYSK